MGSRLILFGFCCISLLASANTNLGKELPFKTKTSGDPSFGIIYTYDVDPDGTTYMLTYSPKVSPSEGAQSLRWNYYLRSEDKFLLRWTKDKTVTLAAIQVLLKDDFEETIEVMLKAQKKSSNKGNLFFVLADEKNIPVYYVPISDFCEKYPDNFHDLTYERRCDDAMP